MNPVPETHIEGGVACDLAHQNKRGLKFILPLLTSLLVPLQMPMELFDGRDPRGVQCACVLEACSFLDVECSIAEITHKMPHVQDLNKCVCKIEW